LPWERQRIQFRAEAFNVLNNVNFDNPSNFTTATATLTLASPSTFGQLTSAAAARVMQFALRYEF